MANASGVQIATLIASLISAAAALIAAASTYFKFRHETQKPRLEIGWNEEKQLLLHVRNYVGERTADEVGFAVTGLIRGTRIGLSSLPENLGPELPLTLQAGRGVTWRIPFEMVKWVEQDVPLLFRWRLKAFVDLGDATYFKSLPWEVRLRLLRVVPYVPDVPIQPEQPITKGPAEWFTGDVYIDPIARGEEPSRIRISNVRFTRGARTAWHSHAIGETLYVSEGKGLVRFRGGDIEEIRAGHVVSTPADEWHWHGAAPDHFMTHLSITEAVPGDERPEVDWGAHVTDNEYDQR